MEILRTAREEYEYEYEYEPPSKYYRDGYNTFKRMEESPEEYLLFLQNPSVPPTNNTALCELLVMRTFLRTPLAISFCQEKFA